MRRLARAAFGMPGLFRPGRLRCFGAEGGPPAVAQMATGRALARIAEISRAALRRSPAPPAPHAPLTEPEVREIAACVGRVDAHELALPRALFGAAAAPHTMQYVEIAESSAATIAVFVLPPGKCIPLHDHPGMFVFSKVLWGALHVESYDLLPPDASGGGGALTGLRNPDEVSPEGAVRVLGPLKGNVHCFRAKKWTAVFDVVLPPYDYSLGRDCTYYEALPAEADASAEDVSAGDKTVDAGTRFMFKPVGIPKDFSMVNAKYNGVAVSL